MLKAIGADEPTPMDVGRVEWIGKGKGKGKEKGKKGEKGRGGWTHKGKGGKGKGKKGDKGKGKNDKGKGGSWNGQGRGKGKGRGGGKGGPRECWNCGKLGHVASEWRQPRRVQQVQDGDQSSVAASTTRTLPSAPSTTAASAKSQVRRIYEYDLTEEADDCWCEDGEYEVRRLNEVGCEVHSHEDVPRNESPAHAVESDAVHDFDVFARDESLRGDARACV